MPITIKQVLAVSALLSLGVCPSLQAAPWQLDLAAGSARPSGVLQTPAGGQPGTATPGHPTLDELGLGTTPVYALGLSRRWGRHSLALTGHMMGSSASQVLANPVTIQAQHFSAGEQVHSDYRLNRYGVRYNYTWQPVTDWTLSPGMEITLMDFSLKVSSSQRVAHRSYHKVSARPGLTVTYQPSRSWAVTGSAYSSLPVTGQPNITDVNLT
ncbi:MAG: hypothetical protein R3292_11670, partial [Alcanivorax sp.]|nr:hypothetical protein [Alcanivorax sp.]